MMTNKREREKSSPEERRGFWILIVRVMAGGDLLVRETLEREN